jgi:hypothetical protein
MTSNVTNIVTYREPVLNSVLGSLEVYGNPIEPIG